MRRNLNRRRFARKKKLLYCRIFGHRIYWFRESKQFRPTVVTLMCMRCHKLEITISSITENSDRKGIGYGETRGKIEREANDV